MLGSIEVLDTFKENATTLIDEIVAPLNAAKVPFSSSHGVRELHLFEISWAQARHRTTIIKSTLPTQRKSFVSRRSHLSVTRVPLLLASVVKKAQETIGSLFATFILRIFCFSNLIND